MRDAPQPVKYDYEAVITDDVVVVEYVHVPPIRPKVVRKEPKFVVDPDDWITPEDLGMKP